MALKPVNSKERSFIQEFTKLEILFDKINHIILL